MPGPVVHPLHWREVPGRTQDWAEALKREFKIDPRSWEREYELNFAVEVGRPAFTPPFMRAWHVPKTGMVANPGLPLIRGWDYGFHHPVCLMAQVAPTEQILYLRAFQGEDEGLSKFVERMLEESRKLMGTRRYESADFDDPSGQNKKDEGLSSREVLNVHGIYPLNGPEKIPIRESVSLVRANLELMPNGKPGSLVDSSITMLIRAFEGAYTAEQKPDGSTRFRGGPTVHIVDAVRYLNAGISKMGRGPCQRRSVAFQG